MSRPTSRFLSQLAHDLRSPLNVVGSTLMELGEDRELSTADREQIVTLSQRAVERLISLSDRLSLASRLDEPFDITLSKLNLVQVTKDTITTFTAVHLRRRIEIITAFPDLPVFVSASHPYLPVLMMELLTNANRFARKQFRVEISALGVLNVDDDGEGIKEDERPFLFEPFAERRSRTGLGMGLWIAQRLAELQHGTLTVEHLPVGTRQHLSLPAIA